MGNFSFILFITKENCIVSYFEQPSSEVSDCEWWHCREFYGDQTLPSNVQFLMSVFSVQVGDSKLYHVTDFFF